MDYPIVGDKECGTTCLLLLASALCMIVLGVAVVSQVAADDHPLCAYFADLADDDNVSVATWIGYPDGWKGMPKVWDYETYTDLANGSGILTRSSKGIRWMWAFRSLAEDNGNHDFCEHVLIVDDSP